MAGPRPLPKLPKKRRSFKTMNPEIIYEDDYLEVLVVDAPGAGGACHEYVIQRKDTDIVQDKTLCEVSHQNGPIQENGVNGVTNEALLAIVKHRLEGFQSGNFPSEYNANALAGVNFSLANLEARTQDRKNRHVEGRNVK